MLRAEVFRVGVYGPREVLPGTIWSGITRLDCSVRGWQTQRARTLSVQPDVETGILLPSREDSEDDLGATKNYLNSEVGESRIAAMDLPSDLVSDIGSVAVTDQGCWQSDDIELAALTEAQVGNRVLESTEEIALCQQCSTSSCLNHRHYDLSFGLPSTYKELLYPELRLYMDSGDELITAWGDQLPRVEESRSNLYELHARCLPHVPADKSPLSAGALGHITFVPTTGCWMARNYHMASVQQMSNGWRADCYGRLAVPSKLVSKYGGSGRAEVAHRTVARIQGLRVKSTAATGMVLNHLCGFKPCANDQHLKQVSRNENGIHGYMAILASGMLKGEVDISLGVTELLETSPHVSSTSKKRIKTFWDHYQDTIGDTHGN